MPKRERTISDVVREIMAALPEVEEFVSHGTPTFRPRGRKVFATYPINHHGDGRVALWLMAPSGAQRAFVKMRPRVYFVPPYVGPSGWLGIELDKGLGWSTVCEHVREAYVMVAPAELVRSVKKDFRVRPPTRKFRPEEIDPFQAKAAQAVLKKLGTICARLPETERGTRFGSPTWQAGKKVFATAHYYSGRLKLSFWVGTARQKQLIKQNRRGLSPFAQSSEQKGTVPLSASGLVRVSKNKRFEISQYTGHNGWIELDVVDEQDWSEIGALALESYRHFALKRMLKEFDED